ncbi:VOC family protein [Amorphus orientalis]|uniref:Enzyme related to lactoylglutathione lyase n=1 Tax=Amorphus orientalis TaxID=649198 RepID=A0AAE4AS76_9HYPH|nr:VOC family protein [Amorphus orientalis]MDQ0315941.1 putative enzyme related to lactoylglutathione lyase [Amorphus orientalis]
MHQGDFVWYEVMTSDVPAAAEFYSKSVGWSVSDAGMPDMTYKLLQAGDAPIAGMMDLPREYAENGGRPAWMGYLLVDDVDAAAAAFEADGGTVHKPGEDIPGVGRFAAVSDPLGAGICLFRGNGEPPAGPAPGSPGTVGWHELYTEDVEKAFAFYAKHFGWEKLGAVDMGEMGDYLLFGRGETMMGGIMKRPANVPVPFWGFYFCVDTIDAGMGRVADAGGQVVNGPHEVPGGAKIAQCLDPQGAFFSITAMS